MTARVSEYRRVAQEFMRVTQRMGEMRNAWRTCRLSDCRRERRCVGDGTPCMFPMREGRFCLPDDQHDEWHDLVRTRSALWERFRRLRAARALPE